LLGLISRFDRIDPKYIFVVLISLYFFVEIPYLPSVTAVWVDEPWYSNVGHNFSIGNGLVNTHVGSGGGERFFLFSIMLGAAFKFLGTSITVARFVSVLGGLTALIAFLCILRTLKLKNITVLIAGVLFIFSNVFYIIFRTVRPESWVVAFGLWSLYFLLVALEKKSNRHFFCCSLLATLSALCHPNGALYVFFFGIISLIDTIKYRKAGYLSFFILGCVPVTLVFLANTIFFRPETFSEFFAVISSRTYAGGGSSGTLDAVFRFFASYSLGIKRLFIVLIEICILVCGLFFYKRSRNLFIVSILGISFLTIGLLLLRPFVTRHFGEVLVFSMVAMAIVLDFSLDHSLASTLAAVLALGFFLNNLAGEVYVLYKQGGNTSYAALDEEIDEAVPDDTTVLTLHTLWFPLKNNTTYSAYTRWSERKYDSLEHLIRSNSVDYVVMSDYMARGAMTTSGRSVSSVKISRHIEYFDTVMEYAREKGSLVDDIATSGYGDIKIFVIDGGRTVY